MKSALTVSQWFSGIGSGCRGQWRVLSYRSYTTLLSHGLDCIIHTLLGIILPSYLYFTVLDCWLAIKGEYVMEHFEEGLPPQLTHWLATLCLCLKAEIASLAVFAYESWHVGPPVIPQNEFEGLSTSHMACDLWVVVLFSNLSLQNEDIQDVDLVMEIPEAVHLSPLVSIKWFTMWLC